MSRVVVYDPSILLIDLEVILNKYDIDIEKNNLKEIALKIGDGFIQERSNYYEEVLGFEPTHTFNSFFIRDHLANWFDAEYIIHNDGRIDPGEILTIDMERSVSLYTDIRTTYLIFNNTVDEILKLDHWNYNTWELHELKSGHWIVVERGDWRINEYYRQKKKLSDLNELIKSRDEEHNRIGNW